MQALVNSSCSCLQLPAAAAKILLYRLCCKPFERKTNLNERTLLCLGIDGAGKTTLVDALAGNAVTHAQQPTHGFRVKTVRLEPHWDFSVWEVGGAQQLRAHWHRYIEPSLAALLYVIDAADASRLQESCDALSLLLQLLPIDMPILIFANKSDIAEFSCVKTAVRETMKGRPDVLWCIHECSALERTIQAKSGRQKEELCAKSGLKWLDELDMSLDEQGSDITVPLLSKKPWVM